MTEKHLENEKDKYISVEEACELLETGREEVDALVSGGKLHAFKLGDSLVRFRKDQVSELKARQRIDRELFPATGKPTRTPPSEKASWTEHVRDFLYFNDFYILSSLVVAALIYLILSSQ